LNQLELLVHSTLGTPETGYLGLGAKATGLFMKTPSQEFRILTFQDLVTDVRAAGTASHLVVPTEAAVRAAIDASSGGSAYVLKAGDTMTGSLNIHRAGQLITALSIKTTASGTEIVEGLQTTYMTTTGSGQYHIKALFTTGGNPAIERNVAYATVHPIRGTEITYGATDYDRVMFLTQFDVIGNAEYVLCQTYGSGTAWIPIASFGGGGGGGTVTSVKLTMPNIFSVTPAEITTAGTFAVSLNTQSAKNVLIAPTNSSGVPAFRSLVAADIPALSYDNYGSWSILTALGSYGVLKSGSSMSGSNYGAVRFVGDGSTISITEQSENPNILKLTFSAIGGGSGGFTNYETDLELSSDTAATKNASTWTTVDGMTLSSLADGTYLVMAHITMVKPSTTGAIVAMRITDGMFTSFAATEHYASSISTNRVNMSVSTIIKIKNGAPSSVSLQMWASTTGWYAAASTPSSLQTGATRMTAVQLY